MVVFQYSFLISNRRKVKINQQTMGIEDESFASLMGSVSTEIRMKKF